MYEFLLSKKKRSPEKKKKKGDSTSKNVKTGTRRASGCQPRGCTANCTTEDKSVEKTKTEEEKKYFVEPRWAREGSPVKLASAHSFHSSRRKLLFLRLCLFVCFPPSVAALRTSSPNNSVLCSFSTPLQLWLCACAIEFQKSLDTRKTTCCLRLVDGMATCFVSFLVRCPSLCSLPSCRENGGQVPQVNQRRAYKWIYETKNRFQSWHVCACVFMCVCVFASVYSVCVLNREERGEFGTLQGNHKILSTHTQARVPPHGGEKKKRKEKD